MKIMIVLSLFVLVLSTVAVSGVSPQFEIKYAYWNVENNEKGMKVLINVAGTTPGAEYMEIRFYTKYENGTERWTPWLRGPFDYGHSENNTTIVNSLFFSPTADNWLAWEYFLDEIIPYNESFLSVSEMRVEVKAILDDGSVIQTYSLMNSKKPEKEKDPRLEEPTYPDVNIRITEAKVLYHDRGNFLDIDITIAGEGDNVSHIALNFIITYKNGTRTPSGWMGGPFNFGSGAKVGFNYTSYYFISKSGRWKEWEFHMNGTIDKKYAPSVYWYDEMSSITVYARAYLDNTEFLWNQDVRQVSLVNEKREASEEKSDYFQYVIFISLLFIPIAIYSVKRNKKP